MDSNGERPEGTRVLPSLESIYPYLLDSALKTKEDRNGVTSDLFNNNYYMFSIRPSPPHSSLAEVKIRPLAVIPERVPPNEDK